MTLATALRQRLMRQARLPAVARAFSTDSPRLIEDVHEFQRVRRALPAGTRVGFVPTMGVRVPKNCPTDGKKRRIAMNGA